MITEKTTARFAAAVYSSDTVDRMALFKFAEKQKVLKTRIGGILQTAIFDEEGNIAGLDAIDIATNERLPISRPRSNGTICGLDTSVLAGTSSIIREVIDSQLDLIVIEKFGALEQSGKGLVDDILNAIAEDIPLIISMSQSALPVWQELSGGLGDVLSFEEIAFEQWWKNIQG
ncbi:MAG: nucleoside-triphosphatase THEP1 [Gammaproteobacteria bacterium]|jgi:nucleoside-triphosphatase THEP1